MMKPEGKERTRSLGRYLIPFFAGAHVSTLVNAPLHWYIRNLIIFCELAFSWWLFERLGRKGEAEDKVSEMEL